METNDAPTLTREETDRRQRLIKAFEKVSANLRRHVEKGTLPSGRKMEAKFFLDACNKARLLFATEDMRHDMPLASFVYNEGLKDFIKEQDIRSLKQFMATPESRFRALCREYGTPSPTYLTMLHRAYLEYIAPPVKQQAWFSSLVRD